MTYGLYISNGSDGAVISNSNTILNESTLNSQSPSLSGGGGSITIDVDDINDNTKMGYSLDGLTRSNQSGVNISTSTDANGQDSITITNNNSGQLDFSIKFFRFK